MGRSGWKQGKQIGESLLLTTCSVGKYHLSPLLCCTKWETEVVDIFTSVGTAHCSIINWFFENSCYSHCSIPAFESAHTFAISHIAASPPSSLFYVQLKWTRCDAHLSFEAFCAGIKSMGWCSGISYDKKIISLKIRDTWGERGWFGRDSQSFQGVQHDLRGSRSTQSRGGWARPQPLSPVAVFVFL